ncbi:MAG: hypothetical protein H5T95_14110 [Firmicutes bacterium]|nr:hypothetical protein [Bacillota bacterium]
MMKVKRIRSSRLPVMVAMLTVLFLSIMVSPAQGYVIPAAATAASAAVSARALSAGGVEAVESCGGSALAGAAEASTAWYFAEGTTADGFDTVIDIANPGETQAAATVTFYTDMGQIQGPSVNVPPRGSASVDVSAYLNSDQVGAKVSSSQPVIAQRLVYSGDVMEANLGATSLSDTHYFTEGYTGPGWYEKICVINPNDADANCTFRYCTSTETVTRTHQVKKKSRLTVPVNDDLGSDKDVYLLLTSSQPVHAERAMVYVRNYGTGDIPGIHIASGAHAAASDWLFAHTSTGEGFEAWLCTLNPGNTNAQVEITYILAGGTPETRMVQIPPASRYTTSVNMDVGVGLTVSPKVHADKPVVCELVTYFRYASSHLEGECSGGSCLPGSTATAKKFFLPGGEASGTHEQWVTLANFGASPAEITLKAYTSGGTVTKSYTLPAKRSRIVNVNEDILADGGIHLMELSSGSDFLAGKADFCSTAVPVPPGANSIWYFAEGCTREGFEEWLCIQNPGEQPIDVHAVYMLFGAEPREATYPVPARSRFSVNVNVAVGPGQDVSVMLWSEGDFFAERPMYFSYKQGQPGYSWDGGHVTFGVTSPRSDWYFAEGCTREGFEEWLCIQNPTQTEAEVYIDYILAGAPTQQKYCRVAPRSRSSVNVNADVGEGQDVSAHVHSNTPIVVERPIYFRYGAVFNPGAWTGGHVVMGTSSPQTEWYFAEGCTRAGFEEWICIQNPNPANAHLEVSYVTSGGVENREYEVAANSRHTLSLNRELGTELDVSCHIISDQPIICERPLYFNYTGRGAPGWAGGSAELGVNAARNDWYFAEGYTGGSFHEWICVLNTGSETAKLRVTYNIQGEVPRVRYHNAPPGRYTIFVNEDAGADLQLSALVEVFSGEAIICERSMYFNQNGWTDGHCASGYAP